MSATPSTLVRISVVACLGLLAVLTGCRVAEPNPGATTMPSDTGIRGTTMVDVNGQFVVPAGGH